MNDEIQTCSPATLSAQDIETCLEILKEGGAVDLGSAKEQIPCAEVVAIRRNGNEIVALGAIKGKRPWYASYVAGKSGFQFRSDIHELGYVAVRLAHRDKHFSTMISGKLVDVFKERPLFATTSGDRMKSALTRSGFEKRGNEWQGETGMLSLWILDQPPNKKTAVQP